MNARKHIRSYLLASSLVVISQPLQGTSLQGTAAVRDGQHDFDFEIGAWKTHLKRLQHPLTRSITWVEYEGTSVVRKVWNGRANLLELEVDGPGGYIEALSLRLYNPQSHQWSLNFASSGGGTLSQPTIGEFKNGRGEFFDQETLSSRAIYVRFVISDITPNSCRFEQAFSADGGKTWEVNWIATDTRLQDESKGASGAAGAQEGSPPSSVIRQSREDAWWTGPMLASSAATLPRGHFLIEPYLYDVIAQGSYDRNGVRRSAPESNGFGSLTYVNYGLADKLTVGLIPTFGYNRVSDGPSSSSVGMGGASFVDASWDTA